MSVEGLEDTLKQANISADDASNLKVRVLLSLSSSGLVNVENATVDVTTVNGVGKTLGDSIKGEYLIDIYRRLIIDCC